MHRSRPTRVAAVAATFALMAAACGGGGGGGGDAGSDPTTTPAPAPAEDVPLGDDSDDPSGDPNDDASEPSDDGSDDPNGSGVSTYEPGDDLIRVVNLLDVPIDVYVRTTDGIVNAYLVQAGVAPGEVTEYVSPPDPGVLAVLEAGAGDAECVATCPHILTTIRASEDTGPVITSVLYLDDSNDQIRSFEAWEQPAETEMVFSNRMPAADPSAGVIVPLGIALSHAQFGLLLAYVGVDGCQVNINEVNVLVGGTSTEPYAYGGSSVDVVLHDNNDRECIEEPRGGPFTVTGGPGTRTLLVLSGEPGAIDAIALPLLDDDDDGAGPAAPGDAGDAGAIAAALADFLVLQLPLSDAEASCLAEFIVDRVGADALTATGGGPIDFEVVDADLEDALVSATISGTALCDIDPSTFE